MAGAAAATPTALELESVAVEVVQIAALKIRQSAATTTTPLGTKSSPTDVVTALDVEVEREIRAELLLRTPGASIIGEEAAPVAGDTSLGWIVDPIDGTTNLVYDLPVIGVSIAASVGGEVVAGAVGDVRRDEIFSAAAENGARCDGAAITPSDVDELAKALVATGFGYSSEDRANEAKYLLRVLPATRDIRCFGSTALHLCWVACGRADATYQRNVKVWDFAAGALIARESGALVRLPVGSNGELLVAASPRVFEDLLRLVR